VKLTDSHPVEHGDASECQMTAHMPKHMRAGGAPKGPQTHVNVLKELIGQKGDRAGDDDRK